MFYRFTFPGGRQKALTFSYDDNQIFDRRLVEILNKNNLKGTFHINANTLGITNDIDFFIDKEEVGTLYKGHEVSCHGFTHPFFSHTTNQQIVSQIWEERKVLEELAGYPVRGMSYPYGDFSQNIIDFAKSAGMEYSRTVENTYEFNLPTDFMRWHPSCHHNDAPKLVDEFLKPVKFNRLHLFYIWGHSFEFNRENTWDMMEDVCQRLGNHDDIWYATNIEIKDYITAAQTMRASADGSLLYNPSAYSIWVADMDCNITEIPSGKCVCIDTKSR